MSEHYNQLALVLDDVNRQTAAKAELVGDPRLATQPHHQDMLKTFFDHGVMKIGVRAGTIRGEYGENSPQDNTDPPETMDPLVPMELLRALAHWVLYEWYSLVDERLGSVYLAKFNQELSDHRFTNTAPTYSRPFSPF